MPPEPSKPDESLEAKRGASPLRHRLYVVIFESDTRAGRLFDIALIVAILASVLVVMLDSIPTLEPRLKDALRTWEWGFTIAFTIEYVLRLWVVQRPLRYARSFFGLVDLFAILPTYMALLFPGAQYLLVIRVLRVLRIFRVLKLAHFIGEGQLLGRAMVASRHKITIFLLSVVTAVTILGSLLYLIEGPAAGFDSIPRAVYWAIVTLTTVGYGDIAPQTPLGQTVAAMIMLLGYGMIAVPTGIMTVELGAAAREAGAAKGQEPARPADLSHPEDGKRRGPTPTSVSVLYVDAFADRAFRGNPAAICLVPPDLTDATLQAIAAELNLSETAFLTLDHATDQPRDSPADRPIPLRWFTPRHEVTLCGHATLAAGLVVLTELRPGGDRVTFATHGGDLTVTRRGDRFTLDLPALPLDPVPDPPPELGRGLGIEPARVLAHHQDPNYYVVLEDEADLVALQPDLALLERLHPYGVAVTAPGSHSDFVSRYFAPGYGIPEDPVTGSIHAGLGPWWADRLGRSSLVAIQRSPRPGRLEIEVRGDRVTLAGPAVLTMRGDLFLPVAR